MTPTSTTRENKPERERLQGEARSSAEVLRAAQDAYNEITRRLLILDIQELLLEQPHIAELSVSSEYYSNDEGGYFHVVNGDPLDVPDSIEVPEDWDEYQWSDCSAPARQAKR